MLAGTATIGSYTTFSTWMLETHRLGEDGQMLAGRLNVTRERDRGLGAALLGGRSVGLCELARTSRPTLVRAVRLSRTR